MKLIIILFLLLLGHVSYAQTPPTPWQILPAPSVSPTIQSVLLNGGKAAVFVAPAGTGVSVGTLSATCSNVCSGIVFTLSTTAPCDGTSGAGNSNFSISGTSLNVTAGTVAGTYLVCVVGSGSSYATSVAGKFTITGSSTSTDGTVASAPNGIIAFGGKTFSFDVAAENKCGDYPLLVNGAVNPGGGNGVAYVILNSSLYSYVVCAPFTGWWLWGGNTWTECCQNPPTEAITPLPVWMTYSGTNCTFVAPSSNPCNVPDSFSPGGTIAGITVIWSQAGAHSVTFASSDTTNFTISGANINTARAFSSANDNTTYTTTITTTP